MTRKKQNHQGNSKKTLQNSNGQVKQIVERILNKRSEKKWLSFSASVAVSSLTAV
jgi:hypothetical protein